MLKKFFNLISIVILIIAITGCGKKEPVKVVLTGENFSEYFSVSTQVSDFTVDEKSDIFGKDYIGYANLKIVVNPKKEFKAEDVSIEGRVKLYGLCWSGGINPYFDVVLDMNGKGEYIDTITTGNCSLLRPDTPSVSKFYDYEPKENEFFINDDEVLITSLSGSIYLEQ